jgi:curved DNA-binding protein CbpA
MSELQHSLELFGLLSIDDVTADTLKKAFKKKVLEVHPDKGGDPTEFDGMLAAFVYLSETYQRINGGRVTLQNVISPDQLREMRPDELINRVFEEFDNENFNKKFEEVHKSEGHGYIDWLGNKEEDFNLTEGEFGDATQKPPTFIFKELEDFNKRFEETAKKDKPEPTAIILHPEAMAYISDTTIGTSIIDAHEGDYTSDACMNPQYTDAYSAFTTNNTLTDKVTTFKETNKTLEDIINERNQEIKPLDYSERQALFDYEKKKMAEQTKHLEKIKNHFRFDAKQNTQLENWPPEKYSDSEYKGFRMDF